MVSPRALASARLVRAAAPAGAVPVGSVYKVVRSGALTPMGFHYDLDAGCRRIKVRGPEVYHRSVSGYTGLDPHVVERVFPNGDAQQFLVEVSVR